MNHHQYHHRRRRHCRCRCRRRRRSPSSSFYSACFKTNSIEFRRVKKTVDLHHICATHLYLGGAHYCSDYDILLRRWLILIVENKNFEVIIFDDCKTSDVSFCDAMISYF